MIDVKHIAKLARLGVSEEEEKRFAKDLAAILDFVNKLSEAKTEGVKPISQITGLMNVTRADQPQDDIRGEQIKRGILTNAPEQERGYFKVKRVLE